MYLGFSCFCCPCMAGWGCSVFVQKLGLVLDDFHSSRVVESKKKAVQRLEEQLMKLEVQATDREENKQIALGTSKLNYLDPRITVAW